MREVARRVAPNVGRGAGWTIGARAVGARAEGAARCRPAHARRGRTPWISPSSSSDSGNAASARTAQIRRSRPILGAADLRAAFARRSARPPEVLEPRPRSTGVRAHGAAHVDNISRVLARRGVRRASQCGDACSTHGLSTRCPDRTNDDAPTGSSHGKSERFRWMRSRDDLSRGRRVKIFIAERTVVSRIDSFFFTTWSRLSKPPVEIRITPFARLGSERV